MSKGDKIFINPVEDPAAFGGGDIVWKEVKPPGQLSDEEIRYLYPKVQERISLAIKQRGVIETWLKKHYRLADPYIADNPLIFPKVKQAKEYINFLNKLIEARFVALGEYRKEIEKRGLTLETMEESGL